MPINVSAETVINRTRDEVSSYATNPGNDPIWVSGITEAKMLTEPPMALGSRVERVASFMGRRIQYVLEVVDWTPNSRMALHSVKGPFPMDVVYEFEAAPKGSAPGSTLVRIKVEGGASGFFKLATPLLSRAVKKSITKDLSNLKALMEVGS